MILLPNVSGDLSKYRLDELLLYLLVKSAVRLSIGDLVKQANNLQLERSFGVRGVRRAISSLCEKGLLDSTHDLKRHCTVYTVNPVVLRNGVRQGQQKLRSCDLFGDIYRQRNEIAFSHSVTFDDLRSADDFVDEFEQFWAEQLRSPNEKIVFHDLLYNRACLSNVFQLTDLFRDRGIVHYVLCQDKRFISRKKEGRWLNRQAFVRLGVAKKQQWDTVVLGSYIITIRYCDSFLSAMNKIYSETLPGDVLQQLWCLRGEIVVTVRKDRELRDLLWPMLEDAFVGPLQSLLSDFTEQKKKSGPLIVQGKYHYVLWTQLEYCLSDRYKAERDSPRTAWSGIKNAANFYSVYLNKMIEHFDTSLPLTYVDLGVGPKIQPGSILHNLVGRFSDVQYIGVDYSSAVLESASSEVHSELSGVRDTSFLQTDFLDSSSSDQILSKVKHKQRIFAMTGSTGSSLEALEFQQLFTGLLRQKGDVFIADTESLEFPDDFKHIAKRYTKIKTDFDIAVLRELGLTDEYFIESPRFVFDSKPWAVENHVVLRTVPEYLLGPVKRIGLEAGDKIRFFKCRKFSEAMFSEVLSGLRGTSHAIYRGEGDLSLFLLAVGRVD